MKAEILLATLNANYHHSSFGLRYIFANLGELQGITDLREFTIAQNPMAIAEAILADQPKIVGLGVYIWNTTETRELVSILKRVSPDLTIILGGPEVSFETEQQRLYELADFIIQGEADLLFGEICKEILRGKKPLQKIISGPLPDIAKLVSPYPYYSDRDIKERVIYVEASRGCPYKCEYCLSSLDKVVRAFPLEKFLADMDALLSRGVKQFKFVDRTFNLNTNVSVAILEFFLGHMEKGLFLHFEMVPDRLPDEIKNLVAKFPAGSLQFEIGIQSLDENVAKLVSRRQNVTKIRENLNFLRTETKVHTHADLIVGLPGETLESFSRGFDELCSMEPDEIQVGILKRLKGTPIIRHDKEWSMVYAEDPPFSVLSTKTMNFQTIQFMQRFAKFWDHFANSGNFPRSIALVLNQGNSKFLAFYNFVEFLSSRHQQSFGISLDKLAESLWIYARIIGLDQEVVRISIIEDICHGPARRPLPSFLKSTNSPASESQTKKDFIPKRQQKHLAGKVSVT